LDGGEIFIEEIIRKIFSIFPEIGGNPSMSRTRIALLAGGWSGEREVSLKSGEAIFRALDKGKYDVTIYDPRDELQALITDKDVIDLAFILLHGKYGEDGRIQGFLDILHIPYVGSGVLSSAMAMNKKVAKEVYRDCGLMVAKDVVLRNGEDFSLREIGQTLGSWTVVKPIAEGSSLGMSVCRTDKELMAGLRKAFDVDPVVLVEEYISGREVTGCVLGGAEIRALPLVEILPGPSHSFFDYEAKYTKGATEEKCPADLSESLTEKAQECAMKAHRALHCAIWSRSDMIIRNDDIYLLETNTIPGMTHNSLFPLAARAAGLSLSELVDELIRLSMEYRQGERFNGSAITAEDPSTI
jgi:D-alanine-D-alanine ligase